LRLALPSQQVLLLQRVRPALPSQQVLLLQRVRPALRELPAQGHMLPAAMR
jgi:hypothetical protein